MALALTPGVRRHAIASFLLCALLAGAAAAADAPPPAAFQLGSSETAAAGRAVVRFVRTNALTGGGGLSVTVKVDGRAVCKLDRGRDCAVTMPAGQRELSVDNSMTLGMTVATLEAREGMDYLIEIDTRASGVLSLFESGARSTEPGLRLTRNDGSYSMALKGVKPGDRSSAADAADAATAASAAAGVGAVAAAAPGAAGGETRGDAATADSAALWAARRHALSAERPDNLRLSSALALLLDVPGEYREALLRMESDFEDKPSHSSLAAGPSTANGVGFGWSWQRRSDFHAVDGALENCAARTDAGGCVTLVRQRKFLPDGALALADKLSTRDYAGTRVAFLRALQAYRTPR